MAEATAKKPIGLLLSGGLDSSILLGQLLHQRRVVRPFYIRSGLVWQRQELQAVRRVLRAMGPSHARIGARSASASRDRWSRPAVSAPKDLVLLDLPLADVYCDHWALSGRDTPDAESADEAVYLPGRNLLLAIKAAVWCQLHGVQELALAVLGSSPFADARPEFFQQFQALLSCAGPAPIRVLCPFAGMGKREVMELGRGWPLELTFSCIAPVRGLHCGKCNKCAERHKAFALIGLEDPTRYASPLATS